MRNLLVRIEDDLDPWLAGNVNQGEVVRKALRLYKGDISTEVDTLEGLRKSYGALTRYMETKFEYYDQCFVRLDKLISVLESRM